MSLSFLLCPVRPAGSSGSLQKFHQMMSTVPLKTVGHSPVKMLTVQLEDIVIKTLERRESSSNRFRSCSVGEEEVEQAPLWLVRGPVP